VPVIVSGGLRTAEQARAAFAESGADAVMIARGSLGNPWIFDQLASGREVNPGPAQIEAELRWILDRAAEHWGAERAARNLRKFYPWYVERLGYEGRDADRFQRTESLEEVRELLSRGPSASPAAAISGRPGASL
jgi:tRNA-dihydrouridine synthase